jgi:DNA polymerase (family 10)
VAPGGFGTALFLQTGSTGHVRAIRERASARGLRLSPATRPGSSAEAGAACETEADIYRHLGLPFVPPEMRHGTWELTAAEAGSLPTPIGLHDIRGDLHVHTLWSDGRDSVEMVALAARQLGYEYVAITDHSPRAAASRVLTRERLERQMDDVDRVRQRVCGITVLQGAEVDILPDGSLDFADEILERLDIVLASLHEPAGQRPDVLLERYLLAMRHPRVHIITHPANRLVGRDEGYPLDYDVLFDAAVATGTVLEIDGGPGHLDMDGHLARRAVKAGVLVSIDSDCHNVARLGPQMALGVGTARRGGVEARHVLNTRPLAEVLAHFAAKARTGLASV